MTTHPPDKSYDCANGCIIEHADVAITQQGIVFQLQLIPTVGGPASLIIPVTAYRTYDQLHDMVTVSSKTFNNRF